jgi:hypothetical protein
MSHSLSSVLAAVVILVSALPGRAHEIPSPNESSTQGESKLKKKLLEIPAGSPVEVKLKARGKIRGRLGDVSDDGFQVKVANGSTIEDRKLTFNQVSSVRKTGGVSTKKIVGYSALAVGITIGVAAAVFVVVIAAAL